MKQIQISVHWWTPHQASAIYLAAAIWSLLVVAVIYRRCKSHNCHDCLEPSWIAQVVGYAAPMAIYTLLILAPLDPDLYRTLLEDRIVVAIAALYGLANSVNDLRRIAGRAREIAASKTSPSSG